MARDAWKQAVEKQYAPPKKIQNLIDGCNTDLYSGPLSKADARAHGIKAWPGFEKALQQISEWASRELPSELWYDADADYLSESEPQGEEIDGEWMDPYLENTWHLERREIYRAIFGTELAGYI